MPWAVVVNLACSAAMLAWLFHRGRTRNVLLCIAAAFTFLAFGPLVNLMLGEHAYQGIVQAEIGPASTGFALALLGLTLADLLAPQRRTFTRPAPTRTYELLPLVMVGQAGYALSKLATDGPAMLGLDKLGRVELAGAWHYPYLLTETFTVALYFAARRTTFHSTLYWVNVGVYVTYCLATTERDFVFVGLAVVVHRQLFDRSIRTRRVVLLGTAGIALASLLAALREGLTFGMTQVLNQGSIPFVDTFVRYAVPDYLPFRDGRTYLDAVLGVLPDALYTPAALPLNTWLVELYAPGSNGGYGFSLTAEAYLNFGVACIPVVFLLLGLAQRHLVNRAGSSDWGTYLSIVFLTAFLGALRGDSAQLVRTIGYGAAFFAVLHVLSTRVGGPVFEARTSGYPAAERPSPTRV